MAKETKTADDVYNDKEIEMMLADQLPNWSYRAKFICRTFQTAGWKGTLMVVNAIGHLAEVAWHHPDLSVSFDRVEVKLMTHDANGITAKDFELALKIEEFVMWRPGLEPSSALDGTPGDARFRYLVYEEK
ncbi:MAG: 4a-hydroxytetrahydrobiopterin dehydratase [Proteobacteria bacterium]|nr:4a-hydroxytetrahydrobiopterin dehydratase [Pseudomonadota bacterium]